MQCYDYCWCCCSLKTKREREIEKDDCKLDWVPLKRNTIQNIQQTAYKRHEFNTKKGRNSIEKKIATATVFNTFENQQQLQQIVQKIARILQ